MRGVWRVGGDAAVDLAAARIVNVEEIRGTDTAHSIIARDDRLRLAKFSPGRFQVFPVNVCRFLLEHVCGVGGHQVDDRRDALGDRVFRRDPGLLVGFPLL